MSFDLRWIGGVSISCLHAACAVAEGRTLVDPALEATLAEPVKELLVATGVAGEFKRQLLVQLAANSGGIENNNQLAEVALMKTLGRGKVSESAVQQLARAVANVENALLRTRPGLVDELLMRGEPLRQQWEARGPGLWRYIGLRTEPGLLVDRADIFLVLPALGGGGTAHWQYNSVRIEAVLANPLYELPEVLRLAWLLSQLQLDLPVYAETISPTRWQVIAPLIMIPAVLSAAEEVELARYDAQTLALAVEHWTGVTSEVAASQAVVLDRWWQTYQTSRPRFPVAFASLAEMI
jgi:hypothetical protein